jgi:hypothetical protein
VILSSDGWACFVNFQEISPCIANLSHNLSLCCFRWGESGFFINSKFQTLPVLFVWLFLKIAFGS